MWMEIFLLACEKRQKYWFINRRDYCSYWHVITRQRIIWTHVPLSHFYSCAREIEFMITTNHSRMDNSKMFIKCIILLSIYAVLVHCGCRKQEVNECESICRANDKGKMNCELRGALILPNLSTIEASLPRVSHKILFYASFHSSIQFTCAIFSKSRQIHQQVEKQV